MSLTSVWELFPIGYSCIYLTIIGQGWAKYCDLSVVRRSIICRSWRLRQIIDLRDIDKPWWCFAITEFNNCFIQSLRLFSYFNHFLAAQGSDLPFFSWESGSNYTRTEYYLQQNTFRCYYAWAHHYLWAVICRSRSRLSANVRKNKRHQMKKNKCDASKSHILKHHVSVIIIL